MKAARDKTRYDQAISVQTLASGAVCCDLSVGDTKARIIADRDGLHIHGSSPSDHNHWYTCPKLTLRQLKAMINAMENHDAE